ncbi:MAG TPA: hypothetical protein VF781_15145 [Solirubrobacteraceae bacterium]
MEREVRAALKQFSGGRRLENALDHQSGSRGGVEDGREGPVVLDDSVDKPRLIAWAFLAVLVDDPVGSWPAGPPSGGDGVLHRCDEEPAGSQPADDRVHERREARVVEVMESERTDDQIDACGRQLEVLGEGSDVLDAAVAGSGVGELEHAGGGVDAGDARSPAVDQSSAERPVSASQLDAGQRGHVRQQAAQGGLFQVIVESRTLGPHLLVGVEERGVVVDVLARQLK